MYLTVNLDRESPEPLQEQLVVQLRQMIVNGSLKPNTQVIATRFFAEQVGVSRTTVLLAYERLISEGYLETRPGIGTFISANIPDMEIARPDKKPLHVVRQGHLYPPLLQIKETAAKKPQCRISFSSFHADPALLPVKVWGQKAQAIIEHRRSGLAEYPPLAGIGPLKLSIAGWLAQHRNIIVSPEQVIIVAGQQQARHLVTRLFVQPGDPVVVEAPCQSDIVDLFEVFQSKMVPVPVDDEGMITDLLPEGRARIACVTPNHQRPLGCALPLQRRERLIEWARKAGAYILEDDYGGKFRYYGLPVPSLAALDPYGLVFHLGTFSKTLGAALCLGYLVVPEEFIAPITRLKNLFSKGCSWLDQAVLSDFISSGDYDHHLRRMRKVYIERQGCLIEAIKDNLGEVKLMSTEAGTHVTCLLPEKAPSAQIVQKAALAEGVGICTLADNNFVYQHDLPNAYLKRALILGYSTLQEKQIREGVAILSRIIKG